MAKDISSVLEELVKRINEQSRRLRILEERNRSNEGRIIALEEMLLNIKEKQKEEFSEVLKKLGDLEKSLLKLENELQKITKELAKTAKKTELQEVEHLIDLFNPLVSKFVTKEEVKRMIEEALR